MKHEIDLEKLNQEITDIINKTPHTWENKPILDELLEAKKTNNPYQKKNAIQKYG